MTQVIYLKLQRYMMFLIGTWNLKKSNNAYSILYKIYSYLIASHHVIMTQLIMASVLMRWDCKDRAVELICYYIQYTNNFIMVSLSKFNMQKVFDYILDYEKTKMRSTTSVEQKIYLKYAKLNNNVSIFVGVIGFFAGANWYITSLR